MFHTVHLIRQALCGQNHYESWNALGPVVSVEETWPTGLERVLKKNSGM